MNTADFLIKFKNPESSEICIILGFKHFSRENNIYIMEMSINKKDEKNIAEYENEDLLIDVGEGFNTGTIKVHDAANNEYYNKELMKGGMHINKLKLSNGVYYFSVTINQTTISKKLIVHNTLEKTF